MNRDETSRILRARSALTSQPYGDDVIDAWHDALDEWTFNEVRNALVITARDVKRITVADVIDRLPRHQHAPETPLERCEICDGSGWADAGTGVVPCRCTTGQQRTDVHRRVLEHNARTTPAWMRDAPPPPPPPMSEDLELF